MKSNRLLLALLLLGALAAAKDTPMQGTIVSENSVSCGSQADGKKKTTELMCQEYVIRTESTEYHVRQEKEAHKALLPVNAAVEIMLKKDRMKFKLNGKEYEMLIVSESAASSTASPATTPKP
jgi:hypothetical protein